MSAPNVVWLGPVALVGLAIVSIIDLHHTEAGTLVVYTTPALQDYLDTYAIPTFERQTGLQVVAVYGASAGEEISRERLASTHPEADLFLHASPLLLEQGFADGLFDPVASPVAGLGDANMSIAVGGGHSWYAFAWSPIVEVYGQGRATPDLVNGSDRLGLAHPILSNNGVYVALLYDAVAPQAREDALLRTRVQPTNSRTTIGGVVDGSFDVTLGYEAVATFYQERGAKIDYAVPLFAGQRATTPVLFSVSLVHDHPHRGAEQFLDFLFSRAAQDALPSRGLRAVTPEHGIPANHADLAGARIVTYDWAQWRALAARLPAYEVNG